MNIRSPFAGPPGTSSVRRFSESLDGTLYSPTDPGYAAASLGYNLATEYRPDFVVHVESAKDVTTAVEFANEHNLCVYVMGTGHHGVQAVNGGLLINTARLLNIQIDGPSQRAVVGAGVRWKSVVTLAAEHGLTPVHGSSGSVGVVGFTLGGGLSPILGRKYGWGADHVTAVEAVTADGRLVRASNTENKDLFWALRGGRNAIGIVTSMEIELLPESGFVGGGLFFDGMNAEKVLSAFRDVTAAAPNELSLSMAFLRLPPLLEVPEFLAGKFVVHIRVAYLDSAEQNDLDNLLRPLRDAAPLLADTVQHLSPTQFEHVHNDPDDPAPFSAETGLLTQLASDTRQRLLDLVGPASNTELQIVELRHLGGLLATSSPTGRSVIDQNAAYLLWAVSLGMPKTNTAGAAEARSVIDSMNRWSTGGRYLNFAPDDGRLETAFSPDDWERLRQVKIEVDPLGRFPADGLLPHSQNA